MKKIIVIIVVALALFSAGKVFAVTGSNSTPLPSVTGANKPSPTVAPSSPLPTLQNPLNAKSITGVIGLIVDILIYIGVAFAILALIWVGFKMVLAQGDIDEIKELKMWFFYIIIGLAILISARVIVSVVTNTLTDAGVVKPGILNK